MISCAAKLMAKAQEIAGKYADAGCEPSETSNRIPAKTGGQLEDAIYCSESDGMSRKNDNIPEGVALANDRRKRDVEFIVSDIRRQLRRR